MRRSSCIYGVFFPELLRVYVGSTRGCVIGRWVRHWRHLEKRIHPNRRVQEAFDQVGYEGVVWAVLEYLETRDLLAVAEAEQRWINAYAGPRLLNSSKYVVLPTKTGSGVLLRPTDRAPRASWPKSPPPLPEGPTGDVVGRSTRARRSVEDPLGGFRGVANSGADQ